MAWTEVYVDPSIAGDSGAGTSGSPYGDLEWAIEKATFDTTNGTRVNIKAGTDEILAAAIDVAMADTGTAAAWVPTEAAPCIFQGYTTTAGDGGIGGISGNNSVGVMAGASGTFNAVNFIDLHMHNCGAVQILNLDLACGVINCELNNTTGGGIEGLTNLVVHGCHIHDTGYIGCWITNTGSTFTHNVIDSAGTPFTFAALYGCQGSTVSRNIIILRESADDQDGISLNNDAVVTHNSIWSNAGTGQGINLVGATQNISVITNNLIEGFSGTGGVGIDLSASGVSVKIYGGNAVQDCTTAYSAPALFTFFSLGDNETLGASPFTDVSASTEDFSPVDTGNVKEGALPQTFGDGAI